MTRNEKIAQKFNAEELLQIVQLRRKKQISSKEVYGCAFMYYKCLHVNGCLLRVAERKRNKLLQHLTMNRRARAWIVNENYEAVLSRAYRSGS